MTTSKDKVHTLPPEVIEELNLYFKEYAKTIPLAIVFGILPNTKKYLESLNREGIENDNP